MTSSWKKLTVFVSLLLPALVAPESMLAGTIFNSLDYTYTAPSTLNAQFQTTGTREIGEVVTFADGQAQTYGLDSITVGLNSRADAARWGGYPNTDAAGFYHPITMKIRDAETKTVLYEQTDIFHVLFRPVYNDDIGYQWIDPTTGYRYFGINDSATFYTGGIVVPTTVIVSFQVIGSTFGASYDSEADFPDYMPEQGPYDWFGVNTTPDAPTVGGAGQVYRRSIGNFSQIGTTFQLFDELNGNGLAISVEGDATAVGDATAPEPGTLLLSFSALVGVLGYMRRGRHSWRASSTLSRMMTHASVYLRRMQGMSTVRPRPWGSIKSTPARRTSLCELLPTLHRVSSSDRATSSRNSNSLISLVDKKGAQPA